MYVATLLRLAVHLLVSRAEHAYVHIEVEDVGRGEEILHLHGLLDARHAAHLRTVALAHLLVARAHTVQKGYAARRGPVLERDLARVEHLLEVGRGDHVVVYTVSILLLDSGVEQSEARSHYHGVTLQILARREAHPLRRHLRRLAARTHLDVSRALDRTVQSAENLLGRRKCRKEFMPVSHLAARVVELLEKRNPHVATRQLHGALHAGDTAAYDYHVFHPIV